MCLAVCMYRFRYIRRIMMHCTIRIKGLTCKLQEPFLKCIQKLRSVFWGGKLPIAGVRSLREIIKRQRIERERSQP